MSFVRATSVAFLLLAAIGQACSPSSGDSGTPTGGTTDAGADAADAAPPSTVFSLYQARNLAQSGVDAKLDGGWVARDSVPCNKTSGDILVGLGWTFGASGLDVVRMSPGAANASDFRADAQKLGLKTTASVINACLGADKSASTAVGMTWRGEKGAGVLPGKTSFAATNCTDGTWLVGGGLNQDISADGYYARITKLGPQDNAWVVRARGASKTYGSYVGTVAICTYQRTEVVFPYPTVTFSVPAGGTAQKIATCPDGTAPLSGGFAMDDDALVDIVDNRPAPDLAFTPGSIATGPITGWMVGAKSSDTVDRTVTVTTVCARNADDAKAPPTFTPVTPDAPAPDPVLNVTPTATSEFCSNGQWPNKITVKNDGGGNLGWVATAPADATMLTITPSSGLLTAGKSVEVTLGGLHGLVGNLPIRFGSNGGNVTVNIDCQ